MEATVTADENVKRALVPNLILQPLVENALKHGVSASDGRGRVEVSATDVTQCVQRCSSGLDQKPA